MPSSCAQQSTFASASERLTRLPCFALRAALAQRYGWSALRTDILAGIVVGLIALPLAMALGIASGAGPEQGIITAIVAGAVIAATGGSRVQVSGPTAAFVVILAPIVAEFGLGGLVLATAMAGLMLLALGLLGLGRAISFVPYPVITGFTAGIGATIAILQLKDLLGLEVADVPHETPLKLIAFARALPSVSWADAAVGALTLAVLIGFPRITRRIPSALVAIGISAAAAALLTRWMPGARVETIASRFGTPGVPSGIASTAPSFAWPWAGLPGSLSMDTIRALLPSAAAIALLGAIESLLSAVIADGAGGDRHDPDAELVGQGLGNVASACFGGIAATGALARTAANVRAGARSPIAAVAHAAFLAVSTYFLSDLLGALPLASLAALLLMVAWNMSEPQHVVRTLRTAPRADAAVLLTCFGLTVAFDMVIAVFAGMVMASILFIRRMGELAGVELVGHGSDQSAPLPEGTSVYRVRGPLFFGAAQRAMRELERIDDGIRTVVIDLSDVPTIDSTGLVNLESAVLELSRRHVQVMLSGVQPRPLESVRRVMTHWRVQPDIHPDVRAALSAVRTPAVAAGLPGGGR